MNYAEDRLSRTPDDRVVLELKRPWPTTGETQVVLEPTEFLRKLAALIPPPRTPRPLLRSPRAPASITRSALSCQDRGRVDAAMAA